MRWYTIHRAVLGMALAASVSACAGSSPATDSLDGPELVSALESIHGSQIKQHMSVLADDRLEGRGLGSAGYDGALAHVEATLKSYGLQAAGHRHARQLCLDGRAGDPQSRRCVTPRVGIAQSLGRS